MEQGKLPWYNLQKNVVVDGEMLIDKRTGKRTVLDINRKFMSVLSLFRS